MLPSWSKSSGGNCKGETDIETLKNWKNWGEEYVFNRKLNWKGFFTSWRFCRKTSIVWISNIQIFYSKYWRAIWILQLLKSVLKNCDCFHDKSKFDCMVNVDATHLISRNFLFHPKIIQEIVEFTKFSLKTWCCPNFSIVWMFLYAEHEFDIIFKFNLILP